MDPLILVSFSGIFGVLAADSFWSACCLKKTVGSVPYTLVDNADTSNFNCMSNCIYERDDNPGGGRFCFKEGNSEVVCNEGSTSSLLQDTTDMSIVIAGGLSTSGDKDNALTSTEECICTATECTCKICPNAYLPEGRFSHTLDNFFGVPAICGGGNTIATTKSCQQLIQGAGWTNNATLFAPRINHSSLVALQAGVLLLLGGNDSPETTEVVDTNMLFSVKLDRNIDAACSIPDVSYIIITGGGDSLLTTVSKFNFAGKEVNLPSLRVGRKLHGCGSYLNGVDTILVVVGGLDRDNMLLSSTETHKIGSSEWIVGQPLARALFGMASVSIEQGVFILGGQDDAYVVRTEILAFKGVAWTPFGNLETARTLAAATFISSTSTVCD